MSFHSRLMAKACSLVGSVDSNGAGGDEALRGDGGDPAVSFVVDQPQLAVVRLRGTDSACRGRCRTLSRNSCKRFSVKPARNFHRHCYKLNLHGQKLHIVKLQRFCTCKRFSVKPARNFHRLDTRWLTGVAHSC